ncbi:hypothetical protein BX070DRAFT_230978 [Coemansia spiralis]|nr:hypothetical protein BX070DRAFT_230978 [Coemansia spiralis]
MCFTWSNCIFLLAFFRSYSIFLFCLIKTNFQAKLGMNNSGLVRYAFIISGISFAVIGLFVERREAKKYRMQFRRKLAERREQGKSEDESSMQRPTDHLAAQEQRTY